MQYSSLVEKVAGGSADAWDAHFAAVAAKDRGEDVILLSVGDPDFDTPQGIIDVAIQAMRAGDTHYTAMKGRDDLRACIARQHTRCSGQTVDLNHVVITSGAQNALFVTTQCICDSGDEVIVLQPIYVTYEATIKAASATPVPVMLDAEQDFRLDADALKTAITTNTKAIYFVTPSNPTGMMLRQSELQAIADLSIAYDLWVVVDEVYANIVFDHRFHHIAGLPGMAERTVTINSLSKTYAMAGWRLGWAIAPIELINHIEKLVLCMLYGLPGFIQQAGLYALEHCQDDSRNMRDIYRQRRDKLIHALATIPGLRALRPDAGMFLMVDVRQTGLSGAEFARRLYQSTGVSVLDATAFGTGISGFIRISYTVADTLLDEAILRIRQFVDSIR